MIKILFTACLIQDQLFQIKISKIISKLSVKLKGSKGFSHILFDVIPFRVYNHLFDCCRKYYDNENSFILCKRFCIQERALSELLNKIFLFCSDYFPEVITEN